MKTGITDYISELKYKRLSHGIIKPPATSDNGLASALSHIRNETKLKFDWSCLKQDKITFTHGKQ